MVATCTPVVGSSEIACPGCHRRLVAPIDQRVRMVCCPKCDYAWNLWDKTETGPYREICQHWKIEESIAHDDADCDDRSTRPTLHEIDLPAAATVADAPFESRTEVLDLLVIEDDKDFCYLMRNSLERAGHRAAACMSAEAALSVLRQSSFDLITTGQMLSEGMTGLQFVQSLRQQGISTPVIMVTGYGEERLAEDARRAGVIDFIVKDLALTYLAELPQRVTEAMARFRADHVRRSGSAMCLSCKRELFLRDDGFTLCSACVSMDIPKRPRVRTHRAVWEQTMTSCGWTVQEILDREG